MAEFTVLQQCLAFERQSYYSGTINGNDVNRIFTNKAVPVRYKIKIDTETGKYVCPECKRTFQSEHSLLQHLQSQHPSSSTYQIAKSKGAYINRKKSVMQVLTDLLRPRIIQDSSGRKHAVGCHLRAEKYLTLFKKFHQCRSLYRRVGALCKHQVCQLRAMCASLGNWFPVSFPQATITPKFIQLVLEMPRRAQRSFSVGYQNEQVVENVHRDVHMHGDHYKCILDPQKRLVSQAKNQWQRTHDGCVRQFNLNKRKKHDVSIETNTNQRPPKKQKVKAANSLPATAEGLSPGSSAIHTGVHITVMQPDWRGDEA